MIGLMVWHQAEIITTICTKKIIAKLWHNNGGQQLLYHENGQTSVWNERYDGLIAIKYVWYIGLILVWNDRYNGLLSVWYDGYIGLISV